MSDKVGQCPERLHDVLTGLCCSEANGIEAVWSLSRTKQTHARLQGTEPCPLDALRKERGRSVQV